MNGAAAIGGVTKWWFAGSLGAMATQEFLHKSDARLDPCGYR